MLTFIKMEFLKLKRSKIFLLSILMAALPSVLMFIATFAFDETQSFDRGKFLISKYVMFLIWILILTVVTSISTLAFGFVAGLSGFSLQLFINSFAELLFANVLLFLTFSPFVFISLFITNMVPAMVGGATLTLVNLLVHGQSWAPYVPWACPYLISSGEIADYSVSMMIPYGVILATFIIGITVSYIYFTKKDVPL